jgi:hypothetical protein
MEKKIIAIMVALVVVALVVVAAVTIGIGAGGQHAGGFTALFDKLNKSDVNITYNQHLNLPTNWKEGDNKKVSDTIVDMWYDRTTVGQTHVYTTHLYFAYLGDKWNDVKRGTQFSVPQDIQGDSWLEVSHGLFRIDVSSATNISAKYSIGDTITLATMLSVNSNALLAFGEWQVADTL